MKKDAEALLAEESTVTACVLTVLQSLKVEEIERICTKNRMFEEIMEDAGKRINLPGQQVRSVIIRSVLNGLEDFSKHLEAARQFFRSGEIGRGEIEADFLAQTAISPGISS